MKRRCSEIFAQAKNEYADYVQAAVRMGLTPYTFDEFWRISAQARNGQATSNGAEMYQCRSDDQQNSQMNDLPLSAGEQAADVNVAAGSVGEPLLRLWVRGMKVDAQVRRNGVINLVVRAQEEDRGMLGRIRQHIANALFRAADLLHPGQDHHAIRVVEVVMRGKPVDDPLPHFRAPHVLKGWPLHEANRDADDEAFLVYEGIEHKQLLTPAQLIVMCGGKEGTDDTHVVSIRGAGTIQLGMPKHTSRM